MATAYTQHTYIHIGDIGERETRSEVLVMGCRHRLLRLTSPSLFTCMGCKEQGAGTRFSCQHCSNYHLHEFCALPPTTLNTHPLHPQHPSLHFSSKPVKGGGMYGKRCDICNKGMAGYTFGCSNSGCSFQMHPCCAMLSTKMSFPSAHPHPLILMPAMPNTSCGECKRSKRRSRRVYRCTAPGCGYHLHAVCAKTMLNGLHANGIPAAAAAAHGDQRTSVLGAVSKIATVVVLEFVGGLMGGLGHSVGDVLGQTIAGTPRTVPPPPPLPPPPTIHTNYFN